MTWWRNWPTRGCARLIDKSNASCARISDPVRGDRLALSRMTTEASQLGYVIKVSNNPGGGAWISTLNSEGIRSIGTLRKAQVFSTREGAQQEIDRLSDHLPVGPCRFMIEQD
jgi:hypothetical protein